MPEFTAADVGSDLPDNFLPLALSILGRAATHDALPLIVEDGAGGLSVHSIAGPDLLPGGGFADRLANLRGSDADGSLRRVFLGPTLRERCNLALPALRPGKPAKHGKHDACIGVIDTGIAFWNPAFRDRGAKGFSGFGALSFAGTDGASPLQTLSLEDLSRMTRRGDRPGGDLRNRAELGHLFADCVHAPYRGGPPLLVPSDFAHGTAMAALAGRAAGPDAPLFGLELPAAVVADASGETLKGLLDLAVRSMVAMIAGSGPEYTDRPIVILLSFAFLGGPHDGARPIHKALEQTLASFAAQGLDVRIVVPMGNHLNDRAHARIAPDAPDPALTWRLMPDDHSPNSVELVHRDAFPTLTLTTPGGLRVTRPDDDGAELHLLTTDGQVIGASWTRDLGNGWYGTRISLAPTTPAEGFAATADAGPWKIELASRDEVQAWILRDDTVVGTRRIPPRRQSVFEDPAYRAEDAPGHPGTDDSGHPDSKIRRLGTASILATGRSERLIAVGSHWSPRWPADPDDRSRPSPYSGRHLPDDPERGPAIEIVDSPRPFEGQLVVANGTRRLFRVSGTSVAAALHAGRLARKSPVRNGKDTDQAAVGGKARSRK
ncbi:hypothetical protein [Jannaschia pohangensis]|uniref:Subtilase family protein n=1 Tax=Jannaschia pohangensis TaxID=390807 RepID=A0A1I3N4C2_9RHOB|nr:hypothetical protein [Jannaschia pohangensis]SFJ04133.1 hypothetical protein SAMN04488095_2049 [Jannaschia pohangensis]